MAIENGAPQIEVEARIDYITKVLNVATCSSVNEFVSEDDPSSVRIIWSNAQLDEGIFNVSAEVNKYNGQIVEVTALEFLVKKEP